ncbi:hypothetical protein HELRODRAFT_74545, partial [Helobdella robusta]|uniref:Sulfhydryl oxidase n=1 Tax=Helobdella robusta TaxID=6412 RepID=T1G1S5_HELRO
PQDCPLEREDLGRNTWSLLHTLAAYIPDETSKEDKEDLKHFMATLGKFYPCDVCANELASRPMVLKQNPPDVRSRNDFCQWMCRLHNSVNERLGKPLFDCSKVDERWKDGWKDGRCD